MRVVVLSVTALLLLGGCDRVSETVADARDDAENIAENAQFCIAAGRVADAIKDRDAAAAREAAEDLVDEAPREIKPEARTLLAGARKAEEGDNAALRTEEFQAAARAVADFARENCDPTN